MRYVSYDTVRQNLGDSNVHTVQDWGHFLGRSPEKLGLAAVLYPQNTTAQLLDRLFNVHKMPANKDSFKSSRDNCFEWGVQVNKIKTVKIVKNVTTNGQYQSEVVICLEENYYKPNDTFVIEGSRDQLFVLTPPRRVSLNQWEYTCRLVANDVERALNLNFAVAGNTTRFRSNYHPELSNQGYGRYQSNIERHRNYLSLHRVSKKVSGQFALTMKYYIEAQSPKDGKITYYKMDEAEKQCYDDFMETRNNNLLFGESNYDESGKCLLQTEDGRDIPMGDGLITQAERYAERFRFSRLTASRIQDAIRVMQSKSQKPTGNKYLIICNEDFQAQFWKAMFDELKGLQLPATAFYSKEGGKDYRLDVGADFQSYSYLGNQVTIAVERAMSNEYSDRAYAVFLDVTQDLTNGKPAMELFTLEGADMVTGTLKGLGGVTGKTSGDMATPLHGYQYDILGYSGAALYNPYRSFIMEETVARFI